MYIQINGQDFISHFSMYALECRERTAATADGMVSRLYVNPEDVPGLYDIYFANTQTKFNIYSDSLSGILKGLIDIRDGNNGNNFTVRSNDGIEELAGVKTISLSIPPEDLAALTGPLTFTYNGNPLVVDNYTIDRGRVIITLNTELPIMATDLRVNPPPDFTVSNGAVTVTPTSAAADQTLVLTFDPNDGRIDFDEKGGVMRITTPSGVVEEYRYTSASVEYVRDPVSGAITEMRATITVPAARNVPQHRINDVNDPTVRSGASLGNTTAYKGLPYYMSKLNEFARTFAMAMNEGKNLRGEVLSGVFGHLNGYNAHGNNVGDNGLPTLFFTYIEGASQMEFNGTFGADGIFVPDGTFNIFKINGKNFHVNRELLEEPALMNTATMPKNEGGESDNRLAFGMLQIYHDKRLFRQGNIMDFINGTAGELGIDLQQAKKFELNYIDVVTGVQNQRLSVSGVSLNEEMTDMVRWQQQFNAAARLVNAIDGIYDTLINRLGAF
jgi:flagellar hook-associated protein FlgK